MTVLDRRPWAAALAVTAVAAGIGAGVAATETVRYEARADVVVSSRGGAIAVEPLLPNLRRLATSDILAGNVVSTLRLPGSPEKLRRRIHASTPPRTQVISLSLSDGHADRARQVTQEVAVVFTNLVHARFGTGIPTLKATVLDPAHVVSRTGPSYLGDTLIGGAVGLVLALAVTAVRRRPAPVEAPRADDALRRREQQLEQRLAALTGRESALVRRAGELALRERAVETRQAELEAVAARAREPEPVPEAEPAPQPQPEPVAEPIPEPQPEPVPVPV